MGEPLLEVRRLVKTFGAMTVTASVDLTVHPGEIHAVIGPNGAGKTTLVAQIAGELPPDSGSIRFKGKDVTRSPVHARSRSGMGRLYQLTSLFPGFSARDNVLLALQARNGHCFRFWKDARRDDSLNARALECLELAGLARAGDVRAERLSHGEQRQLEVAMVMAGRPRLMLLDEPTAGMGAEETSKMVALLSRLRESHSMLLVEHDLEAVYALADRISVLVYGRVIASGGVEEIRSDPEVRKAYLGEDEGES